jgi:hypothetical protein
VQWLELKQGIGGLAFGKYRLVNLKARSIIFIPPFTVKFVQ